MHNRHIYLPINRANFYVERIFQSFKHVYYLGRFTLLKKNNKKNFAKRMQQTLKKIYRTREKSLQVIWPFLCIYVATMEFYPMIHNNAQYSKYTHTKTREHFEKKELE